MLADPSLWRALSGGLLLHHAKVLQEDVHRMRTGRQGAQQASACGRPVNKFLRVLERWSDVL